MSIIKPKEYTGYSNLALVDAIGNALQKAGEYNRIEIIETRSTQLSTKIRHYQVTLATFLDNE